MSDANAVGLLLAAGQGRRFDATLTKNKLTQTLTNGTPVAVQTARNLFSAVTKVIAVTRCPILKQQLAAAGCETLLFAPAEPGMGTSLAFAMHHLINSSMLGDSVLVALADMPYVQPQTYQRVVAALAAGADIAQPNYRHQPGHPVGFSNYHFPALMKLTGDAGARYLLREFAVHSVPVNDAGILRDIDFLSDLSIRIEE